MTNAGKLMTVPEVALYLRLNEGTIYRLARGGKIPARKVGGTWRFDREQIDAWLAGHPQRPRRGRPRRTPSPPTTPAAPEKPALPEPPETAPLILAVDDEAVMVDLLFALLKDAGYRVIAAPSGREALAALEGELPELILLDLMMPEIDGLEVLRRVRADPRTGRIPVVFLTGSSEEEAKLRVIETGADDYVLKPFSMEELRVRVAMHLRRTQRERGKT